SAIAAAGLAGTAIADMVNGQTPGADEAQHLVVVAGALLLIWQAKGDKGTPARAMADDHQEGIVTRLSGPETGTPEADRRDASGFDDFPDLPGGGAASAPDPYIAARAEDHGTLPVGPGGVTPPGVADTGTGQNTGKAGQRPEGRVA
ncbi:MAG TPA: hypothetical protein VHF26_06065, partial [Trebonia sp.]|nr:hypothetical protein [Trebonia sp.]